MKFYKPWLDDFDAPHKIYADMKESEKGEYATRADAEQVKQECDAYKKTARDMEECVDNVREAMGLESTHFLVLHDDVREMRLKGEQAAKDAVEMAKLVQEVLMRFYQKLMWPGDPKMIEAACKQDVEWQDAQAIIERYEGGKLCE